jgi:hypothetical protein
MVASIPFTLHGASRPMALSWQKVSAYLMTSTSILGAAVATPTFIGAITHTITWREAALPLLGAVISMVIPQKLSPPASGAVVIASVGATVDAIATAAAASPNATVREVAAVAPEIVEELEHAYSAYVSANARLDSAKAAAGAQASKLTATIAKTTISNSAPIGTVAPGYIAEMNSPVADPGAHVSYTPAV